MVIPYRHPISGQELIYRVRLDIPAKANGKEIRYLGAKGVPNHLFFPPGWDETLLKTPVPFIWTEGEFKSLVTQDAGLPQWRWRLELAHQK